MPNNANISVVIPTYNASAFLVDTLDSIRDQYLHPVELIIVDDCSTDNTVGLAQAIAKTFPIPVRISRLARNSGGPATPMNEGIGMASTDWVCMLDQDDLMCSNRIADATDAIEKFPQASFILGNYVSFNRSGELPSSDAVSLSGDAVLGGDGNPLYLHRNSYLPVFLRHNYLQRSCSNHIFKKTLWRQIGGYDSNAKLAADYDFFLRGFMDGIVWLPARQFSKRVHENNAWKNDWASVWLTYNVQCNALANTSYADAETLVNGLLLDRTKSHRWREEYNISVRFAFQLIRRGMLFDGGRELAKSVASAIRSLMVR
jgi:glycosyltransferase involved in cell wall biosynthesis